MSEQIEVVIRGAEAYNLARRALEQMERHKVWPTPLNYELWLHAISDPEGDIGREIQRIIKSGESLTDAMAEDLASQFLPRLRLSEEIRDAGDQLTRQLEAISVAINAAQSSTNEYGRTLEGAKRELGSVSEAAALRRVVDDLSVSTRRVQKENAALDARLLQSTDEVKRLRAHLDHVRREAMTDALTNLANRKAFDEAFIREIETSAAAGKPISVALLDIDHFKRFNDTWGHQTGDQVIRYVATLINRASVQPRMAARYGGEEFAIMFPGEDAHSVVPALDALRNEISCRSLKRRTTDDDLGVVTVSGGVATVHAGESPLSALDRADKALYESKRGGRNRTTNAEPSRAA